MTQLERLQKRTDEPDEAVLEDMLESAKSIILGRRFPYGDWPTKDVVVTIPAVTKEDETTGETIIVEPERTEIQQQTYVEPRYENLQLRIAEDMYNRIGASGQLSHSENGISRSWGSEWVSEELLQEIVPCVGVPK